MTFVTAIAAATVAIALATTNSAAKPVTGYRDFQIGMTAKRAYENLRTSCEKAQIVFLYRSRRQHGVLKARNCYQGAIMWIDFRFRDRAITSLDAAFRRKRDWLALKARYERDHGPGRKQGSRASPVTWYGGFSAALKPGMAAPKLLVVKPNSKAAAEARAIDQRIRAARLKYARIQGKVRALYRGKAVQGLRGFQLWMDKEQHAAHAKKVCRYVATGPMFSMSPLSLRNCYGHSYGSIEVSYRSVGYTPMLVLVIRATVARNMQSKLVELLTKKYGKPVFDRRISKRLWFANFQISVHRPAYSRWGPVLTIYSLYNAEPARIRKLFGVKPQKLKL